MEQNKVRTYLLYGIGEILLVVIGILIALQVNNWNETRKSTEEVDKTLIEIRSNLQRDLSSLNLVSTNNESIKAELIRLTENHESIPDDSLVYFIDRLHRVSSYNPVSFGYDKLERLTIPSTVPDSLTRQLAEYYTDYDGGLNNIAYRDLSIYNINKYRDYMIAKGFPVSPYNDIKNRQLSALRKIVADIEFKGIARSAINSRNVQSLGFREAKENVQQCINQIDIYLNQ